MPISSLHLGCLTRGNKPSVHLWNRETSMAFAKWQHQTWQSEPPSEEYIYRQFPHSKKTYGFWRSFQCHVLPCLAMSWRGHLAPVPCLQSGCALFWTHSSLAKSWGLGGLGRCPFIYFLSMHSFRKAKWSCWNTWGNVVQVTSEKSGFRLLAVLAINNDPKQSVSCVSRSENSAKTDGHPWWSDDLYLYHFVPRSLCNFHWLIDSLTHWPTFGVSSVLDVHAHHGQSSLWDFLGSLRTLRTVRTSNLNSRNSNCFKRSSPWRHEISWDFLLRFPSQWASGQNPITNTYVRGSVGSYFGTVLYPLWRNM